MGAWPLPSARPRRLGRPADTDLGHGDGVGVGGSGGARSDRARVPGSVTHSAARSSALRSPSPIRPLTSRRAATATVCAAMAPKASFATVLRDSFEAWGCWGSGCGWFCCGRGSGTVWPPSGDVRFNGVRREPQQGTTTPVCRCAPPRGPQWAGNPESARSSRQCLIRHLPVRHDRQYHRERRDVPCPPTTTVNSATSRKSSRPTPPPTRPHGRRRPPRRRSGAGWSG